ncbi:MAG TPA: NUDIX pyrophosphatase [Bacteroidota bacterium]|nr:NUDIX pyrophosphatase [Bacteroidota bacterium]
MPTIVSNIVEVCVFRKRQKPEFLILKRAQDDKIYPGAWQLISGSVEPREKALDAAIRELREETQLEPKRFWTAPLINAFLVPHDDIVHLTTVFAAEIGDDAHPKLSMEHEEFRWVDSTEAISTLLWPGQKKAVQVVQEYILGSTVAAQFTEIPL